MKRYFICPRCETIHEIDEPMYGIDFQCNVCNDEFPLLEEYSFDSDTEASDFLENEKRN